MRSRKLVALSLVVLLVAVVAVLFGFVASNWSDDRLAWALSERQARWKVARPTRWERPPAGGGDGLAGNAAEAQGKVHVGLDDGPHGVFARMGRLESPVDQIVSSGELDAASRALVLDRESEIEELLATTRQSYSWDPDQYTQPYHRLASVRLIALAALGAESGGECFDLVTGAIRLLVDGMPGHMPMAEEARAAGVLLFAGLTCADRANGDELHSGFQELAALSARLPLPADRIASELYMNGSILAEAVGPPALDILLAQDWQALERRSELLAAWEHILVEARFWRRNRRAPLPALFARAAETDRRWRDTGLALLQSDELAAHLALDAAIATMFRLLVVATDAARLLEAEGRLDVIPPSAADPRRSDPFSPTSAPLLFLSQEAAGHTLIYSVGPNRRDDHGREDDFAAPVAPR